MLCNLEYAVATANWYAGEYAGRSELPPNEGVLTLAMNIANIGEALDRFEKIVKEGHITYSEQWDQRIKNAWSLLQSEEMKELKRNILKYVRDKSTFHVDPKPVKDFINQVNADDKTISIWETDELNRFGYSPLAANIIASTLIDVSMYNSEVAKKVSQAYRALRDVTSTTIMQIYKTTLED
ncbi:hypothetical protein AB6A23_12505 [Paenibacillus tarimensis]